MHGPVKAMPNEITYWVESRRFPHIPVAVDLTLILTVFSFAR